MHSRAPPRLAGGVYSTLSNLIASAILVNTVLVNSTFIQIGRILLSFSTEVQTVLKVRVKSDMSLQSQVAESIKNFPKFSTQ